MVNAIAQCLTMISILVIFEKLFPIEYNITCSENTTSLKDIATRDLTIVGRYDTVLLNSFKQRLTYMVKSLKLHTTLDNYEIEQNITEWYKDNCYDPDRKLEFVLRVVTNESSITKDLDYTISKELPQASKVLRFNDYVDIKSLDALYERLINNNKEVI